MALMGHESIFFQKNYFSFYFNFQRKNKTKQVIFIFIYFYLFFNFCIMKKFEEKMKQIFFLENLNEMFLVVFDIKKKVQKSSKKCH